MTDEAFIDAFERTTLPADEFTHAAHVRAGWWYLRHHSLGIAIDRFTRSLRAFADAKGVTGKYHETLTVAWMLLIAERLPESREMAWEQFVAQHSDLLEKPSPLARYYSSETLQSDRARGQFVMPDLSEHRRE